MDYKDIIGHEKVIEALKKIIKNGTISHSYLFEGEDSIGKKKVGYAFAKALLCRSQKPEPCNECLSCYKFDNNNHPDFFLIEPDKGSIRVPQIEAIIREVTTLPLESKRKIFLIDDSHKMNIESNIKLLKTLEEPPAYVHFILVSSNSNNLLPTILSRVQTIKFYPVEYDKIVDLLVTDHGKTYEEAKFIAEFTKGAVGKSISLSKDEEFFQRRDEILKTIDYLVKGDKTLALSQMNFFRDNKDDIDEILDIFLLWFRDLLLFKELGQVELLINKDKLNNLSSQSQVDIRSINDIIVRIEETKSNLRRNVNYDLAIQTMLLNIGGIQCNDKGSRSKI